MSLLCRKLVDRMHLLVKLVIVLALPMAAQAEDQRLAEIRATLQHIREEGPRREQTRGASQELTTVKHELRDWVESHLGELSSDPNDAYEGQDTFLAGQLNAELRAAHLLCSAEKPCIDNEDSLLGYLGEIRLEFRQRDSFLVLITSVGIVCGFDRSAYLYKRDHDHWNRVFESEQNTYTEKEYTPQDIEAVLVSPYRKDGTPLVMTLGTQPWCSSNWRDVYVRLWRTSAEGAEPKLLLDETQVAFLGGHDIPIEGSLGDGDALVEFTIGSFADDISAYEEIWHYRVHDDKVERIDPVALNPRDFTEEWLTQPWTQAGLWSRPSNRTVLQRVHEHVKEGEFLPTLHCRQRPDLWQVGIDRTDEGKRSVYFLVQWRPPYRFTMVRALNSPSLDCTEKDDGSGEPATLFPVQDWRE
jgi:hypothetical protein